MLRFGKIDAVPSDWRIYRKSCYLIGIVINDDFALASRSKRVVILGDFAVGKDALRMDSKADSLIFSD